MSRSLNDLDVGTRAMCFDFQSECQEQGLDILITCTFRPPDEQARLFRQGRTLEQIHAKQQELIDLGAPKMAKILIAVGPQSNPNIVTNAGPGQSVHQYRKAFDFVPVVNGKPVWGTNGEDGILWQRCGRIAENVGLEWAGRWTTFREFPHCQQRGFDWHDAIKTLNSVRWPT